MRRFVWTSLMVVLMMALGAGALGSSGVTQRGCVVTLSLNGEIALDQPIARWMNELCDMVNLKLRCARWDDARSVVLVVTMGSERSFDLTLIREGGQTLLSSSLLDAPVALDALCDWADELLDMIEPTVNLPATGRAIAVSGERVALTLKAAAVRLRAWAATARATEGRACEACGTCEACKRFELCEVTATLLDAVAERFDDVVDENVLVIDIAPFDVIELPAQIYHADPAPDGLNTRLVKQALWSIGHAIVDNPLPSSDNL